MRILVAPDSFKESIAAADAAEAVRRGLLAARPGAEVRTCPIADGGEGLIDALLAAVPGKRVEATVTGPLGEPVRAAYARLEDGRTAVVELAAASGLPLVPRERREPLRTTTAGTGELIAAAVEAGAKRILLGIGGSATNDAGCGAAAAMNATFFRGQHVLDERSLGGGSLASITRVDLAGLRETLRGVTVEVACDVTNPLFGPTGAAHVFAPQKGATPEQVEILDRGLRHFATLFPEADPQTPGAGAAGGFGFGAVAMMGATLRRGIDLVLDAVRFDERLAGCDLCITGEGRFDGQTSSGKAVAGVAAAARKRGVPVVALVGSVGPGWERHRELGVERVVVIGEGLPAAESMRRAAELLERAAARVVSESP